MSTADDISGSALHAFVTRRMSAGERLYAVVDAAADHNLAFAPRDEFDMPMYSLFDGDTPDFMHDVAPYVFSFDVKPKYPYHASALLDRFAARLGRNIGMLALSGAHSRDLVLHLRRVFRVTTEDHRAFYFRFYDPRVLRQFLPTCTPDQAEEFFGPMRLVMLESGRPGALLTCSRDRSGAKMDEAPISAKDA